MSQRITKGQGHKIIGQQISWAGECPWTETLCFGTESGHFYLPEFSESVNGGRIRTIEIATEAINGVAFSGQDVGFSSRDQVVLGFRRQDQRHGDWLELS